MNIKREIHCQACRHPNRVEIELNAEQKAEAYGNWFLTNKLVKEAIARDICPNCGEEYRRTGTKIGLPRI